MKSKKYFYLITYQYLGFRYHGWAQQPNVKTVEKMLSKTINYVLDHDKFKLLTSSRTDAMVSALDAKVELFIDQEVDQSSFLEDMNFNLPADIKLLSIKEVDNEFRIINDPKQKEYIYLFTYQEKPHPFTASLMSYFPYDLDIEKMKKAAELYNGKHNFSGFTYRIKEETDQIRDIDHSSIEINKDFSANFFPSKSYIFRLRGKGFMRYQVRIMMGMLVQIGKDERSLEDLRNALETDYKHQIAPTAPASGLILNKIEFIE